MRLKSVHLLLLSLVLAVLASAPAFAEAPVVTRVTRAAARETMLIFGEGFGPGPVEVYAWEAPNDEEAIKAAAGKLPQKAVPPAAIPKEAKRCQVLQSDGQVIAVLNPGGSVLYVKNGQNVSAPFLYNTADPWWAEFEQVVPGSDFRLFGKGFYANFYQPKRMLYLRNRENGNLVQPLVRFAQSVPEPRPNPYYVLNVRLPQDIPAGDYDIYLHNNAGGVYGWSKPIPLKVGSPKPWPKTVFNVREHGAQGDGIADDTTAVLAALKAAADAGGGIVFLPPGTYNISRTLQPGKFVQIRGAGEGATTIRISEEYGFTGTHRRAGVNSGLIVLDNYCGVSDLTIFSAPPLHSVIFVRHEPYTEPAHDLFVRRVTFRGGYDRWDPEKWTGTPNAIAGDSGVVGFEVTHCSFLGRGALSIWASVDRGNFSFNYFNPEPAGACDLLSLKNMQTTVIEGNMMLHGHRGFVSQTGRPYLHNYISDNVTQETGARRHNAAETYLLEGGGSLWRGRTVSGDTQKTRVAGAKWKENEMVGRMALVVGGRGLGQYRFITGNDADSFTVSEPWLAAPDGTTLLTVGNAFVENLLLDNSDLDGEAALQFYGMSVANVTHGHISRNSQGIWYWNREDDKHFLFACFNELINSRTMDRGTIFFTAGRGGGQFKDFTPFTAMAFGNVVRECQVTDFKDKPGNQHWPYWLRKDYATGEPAAVWLSGPRITAEGWQKPSYSQAYNLFEGNQILRGGKAFDLGEGTYFTIMRQNRVDGVQELLADKGTMNLMLEPQGMGK